MFNTALAPSIKSQGGADPAKKHAGGGSRGSVRHVPFERVQGKDFDLPQLAPADSFTVHFTSDTCPTCIALEPAYEALVRKRPDVSVIRIDLPEGSSFTADTKEEFERLKKQMEDEAAKVESALKRFGVCGTPHICR